MSRDLREIITGYGGNPEEWVIADDVATWADAVEWELRESKVGGFVITRSAGCYEQQCDADSVTDAIKIMRAMDAAECLIESAMRGQS